MMRDTGTVLGSMRQTGMEIQHELVHALLLLVSALSSTGAAGVMLVLDDAAHLDPMVGRVPGPGAGGGQPLSSVSGNVQCPGATFCDLTMCTVRLLT